MHAQWFLTRCSQNLNQIILSTSCYEVDDRGLGLILSLGNRLKGNSLDPFVFFVSGLVRGTVVQLFEFRN